MTQIATLCDALADAARVATWGGSRPDGTLDRRARSVARGFVELGYSSKALVLVAVDGADLLDATFGAWWAGHPVAVVVGEHHSRRDSIAFDVGAFVQVCDASEAPDEEHFRHREVPTVTPGSLRQHPVGWAPRCRPGDRALVLIESGEIIAEHSHADLVQLGVVTAEQGFGNPNDTVAPASGAPAGTLVLAAAIALVGGAALRVVDDGTATVRVDGRGRARRVGTR